MNRRKKVMLVISVIIVIVLSTIVWFNVPFSQLKSKFKSVVNEMIVQNNNEYGILGNEVYTEADIQNLPTSIQKFFRYTGLIGKQKIYNAHVVYGSTDYQMSQDKPKLKIKYQHYSFLKDLGRVASIDSSMVGIPFEGLDSYTNGKGSMKGMIAKSITLFNATGFEMDVSSLVTCLCEMIYIPTIALQNYVVWESIDENTAKAIVEYNGQKVNAIFKFKDSGEIISAETDDRYMDEGNGKSSKHKWIVEVSDYIEENGIKYASKAKVSWILDTGNFTYFNSKDITIQYNVK